MKTYEEININKLLSKYNIKKQFRKKFGNLTDMDKLIDNALKYPGVNYNYVNSNNDFILGINTKIKSVSTIRFIFFENDNQVIANIYFKDIKELHKYFNFIQKGSVPLSTFGINVDYTLQYSYNGFAGESVSLGNLPAVTYENVYEFIDKIYKIDYDKIFEFLDKNSKRIISEEDVITEIGDFFIEIEDMYGKPVIDTGNIKDTTIIEMRYSVKEINYDDFVDANNENTFEIYNILKGVRKKLKSISEVTKFVYKFKNQELIIRLELKLNK